jgi:hypothetical protein
MTWEVEYTDEFGRWWETLSEEEQKEILVTVGLLERKGPHLRFPYSSGVGTGRYPHLRELRVQVGGQPIRVFYAFDPRRVAILLIGGDKTGDDRFYEKMVAIADRLYDTHLKELRDEKLI